MERLQRAAEADPSKAAVVCGARRLSYGELLVAAEQRAAGLHALGMREGDTLAVVLPGGVDFVVAFFAAMRLGAILLPLNPQYTSAELARFLGDGLPRIILTDARRADLCRDVALRLPAKPAMLLSETDFADLGVAAAPLPPATRRVGPALYLYTSGSTDTFKRVLCTQENLYYEAHNFVETLGLGPDDNILCAIPLYHSYGVGNGLLDAVYQGSTLVLLDVVHDDSDGPFGARTAQLFDLAVRESVRVYPGVPHQFAALAALGEEQAGDLSGLRLCVSSGDILPRDTFERFLARYGHPIRSLYGSTEAGSIAVDVSPASRVEFGSLGKPLANVSVDIRGADGQSAPRGVAGAIWIRSPVIPDPVYDNRAPDPAIYRDRYFNSGDEGLIDDQGRLVMTGRKQSFIDIAGYKVDIAEVEEALRACPGVREAAALGVEIPRMGTLIKAVVSAETSITDADIRAHCLRTLAFFKVPRLIERRDHLPRSPIGKILKSELCDVDAYLAAVRTPDAVRLATEIATVAASARRRLYERLVASQAAAVLDLSPRAVSRTTGFTELGLDSFRAIELTARLEYVLERALPETVVFDYPTVAAVAAFLALDPGDVPTQAREPESVSGEDDDILTRLERRMTEAGD